EFHMGDDAGRFRPIDEFLRRGFLRDSFGLFRSPTGDVAFPFLEGRGIDQFHCFAKRWVRGKGRSALWEDNEIGATDTGVQYLMPKAEVEGSSEFYPKPKIGVMDVTAAVNSRTVIATVLPLIPTGHSVMTIRLHDRNVADLFELCAILNSFCYDYEV